MGGAGGGGAAGEGGGEGDGGGGDGCGGGEAGGGATGGACATTALTCPCHTKSADTGTLPPLPNGASATHRPYTPPAAPSADSCTVTVSAPSSAPPVVTPAGSVAALVQPPSDAGTKRAWSPGCRGWLPEKVTAEGTACVSCTSSAGIGDPSSRWTRMWGGGAVGDGGGGGGKGGGGGG